METLKRKIATLVPYYLEEGVLHFFLQKRDTKAPTYAGYFGFFGGGVEEEETPTEAVIRETQEELLFSPIGHTFFTQYERPHSTNHVFFLEVYKGFDQMVTVCEGEYGVFLTLAEVIEHERAGIVLDNDLLALQQLSAHLLSNVAP